MPHLRRNIIVAFVTLAVLCLGFLLVKRIVRGGNGCGACSDKARIIMEENHRMAVQQIRESGARVHTGSKVPLAFDDETPDDGDKQQGEPEHANNTGNGDAAMRKGADGSPYLNGPVILEDADLGKAVRLLNEAAGGASIVVESALLEQSAKSAQGSAGITMTLANITFEDALSALTAANGWTWRREAGVYMITTRETANAGIDALPAAVVHGRATVPITVSIYRPAGSAHACDLLSIARAVVPETTCDPEQNTLLLRGREQDVARAKKILSSNVE